MKNYEDVKKRLEHSFESLKNLMQSQEAEDALKALEATFGGDSFVPGDPYATHLRLGEKRVVEWLKELREDK